MNDEQRSPTRLLKFLGKFGLQPDHPDLVETLIAGLTVANVHGVLAVYDIAARKIIELTK